MGHQENLFSEFETVAANEWLEKVVKDLKGKPLEGLNRIVEEIELTPFYHQDNQTVKLGPIAQGQQDNDWCLVEEAIVNTQNLRAANLVVLNALNSGTNGYRFFVKEDLGRKDLEVLLKEVEPAYIQLHFVLDKEVSAKKFAKALSKVLETKKGNVEDYLGSIQTQKSFGEVELPRHFNTLVIEDLTSSAVDQLTNLLSQEIEILSAKKIEKEEAQALVNNLSFKLRIGQDYFLEIAKLRALRVLHANILDAFGLDVQSSVPEVQVNFDSSVYDKKDPNHNLIGITTMTMAAAIGGANVITVLPADKGASENAGLYQRMARNVQHILKLESFLDRVVDPAAGSYYVEHLTNELCEKVWQKLA